MLTDEQYNELKPIRGYIFSDELPAQQVDVALNVYKQLGLPPVNMWCRSCQRDMLAQLKLRILEYENKK